MRFAGPRMTYRHPLRALNHLLDKLRKAEHPLKRRLQRKSGGGKGSEAKSGS